jgi:SAM-dependent methyltransferase
VSIVRRFREIGLTSQAFREMAPRHAALRDDPLALAIRRFRDRIALTAAESAALFMDWEPPPYPALDIVEDLYLFSDPDDILGPGETTAILYRAARRVHAVTVFDLGCGCGTLSLLLARYADRVVGTDINPRAVALSQYNAAANGVTNVEFREGSLYEPVAHERFDLIVSQPPYIPRTDTGFNPYYHAGPRGDELACEIATGAVRHLLPYGRALIFSDWSVCAGETLRHRIPQDSARVTVFASPAISAATYFAGQAPGIVAVHNCLLMLQPGKGYIEREILPHQWASIDIESFR